MFLPSEMSLGPTVIKRVPLIEGQHFKPIHQGDQLVSARIERPLLSKDIFEMRSAQVGTPHLGEFIFDEQNRVLGRRIQFAPGL